MKHTPVVNSCHDLHAETDLHVRSYGERHVRVYADSAHLRRS